MQRSRQGWRQWLKQAGVPLRDGRVSSTETGRLFKCVRELQDAEILLVAADDLHADGKTFGRKAGRP
jgi:hypothetical protein